MGFPLQHVALLFWQHEPSPDWLNTSCLLLIGLQKHTQASRYAQISGGVVVLTVGAFVYDRVSKTERRWVHSLVPDFPRPTARLGAAAVV